MSRTKQDRFGRWIGRSLSNKTADEYPSDHVWQRIANQLTIDTRRSQTADGLQKRQLIRRAG